MWRRVSVHQGCGLTNAMTGITEAAKSRTPLVVVAAEATRPSSNFYVDQPALAAAVGAVSMRVTSADEAVEQAAAAVATAVGERRVVLLNLPLDVQTQETGPAAPASSPSRPAGGRRWTERTWSGSPPRSARPSGRCSWPAAAPADPAAARRSNGSPTAAAPCWRRRPWRRACSPAAPGPSTSPAASPPRWPPS